MLFKKSIEEEVKRQLKYKGELNRKLTSSEDYRISNSVAEKVSARLNQQIYQLATAEIRKRLAEESFIDEVVEKINRKQLT